VGSRPGHRTSTPSGPHHNRRTREPTSLIVLARAVQVAGSGFLATADVVAAR
jgi:hypothetical protein